jgi:AcrR family transcriptional regulator
MEEAILVAAGELFDRQGFNQTSLRDIADAVGMARASLYHYFESREQILVAGVERLTTARNRFVDETRSMRGSPMDRLNALMLGLGTLIGQNPVWVRVLSRDEAALPEDTRTRDRDSRLAYFELLVDTLREGMDRGLIRRRDERATALTIVSAIGGLQGQYVAAAVAPSDNTAELIVDVILRGVLATKRRPGTPTERGLDLILEGVEMIRRADPPRA